MARATDAPLATPSGNDDAASSDAGQLIFTLAVTSFHDVTDETTIRGFYTVYNIDCTVQQTCDGSLCSFSAQRRYTEWRRLHAQQWNGSRTFPQGRRLLHGHATKQRRAEALQVWLCDAFAAYASAGSMPPPPLLHFVGVRAEALAGMAPPPASPQVSVSAASTRE